MITCKADRPNELGLFWITLGFSLTSRLFSSCLPFQMSLPIYYSLFVASPGIISDSIPFYGADSHLRSLMNSTGLFISLNLPLFEDFLTSGSFRLKPPLTTTVS
ncbi:hypothetical protein C8R44DRAFT_144835 [Mycena epipterygia]|nr:hypothetical protein C8R44DRAFT_144835 [Mycena epipterygia]